MGTAPAWFTRVDIDRRREPVVNLAKEEPGGMLAGRWRVASDAVERAGAMIVALVVATTALIATTATPAAAASTISVRGTVACPSGMPVAGVWLQSSGGGSNFATWTAYPDAKTIARFSRSFATTVPTTVYLNVGCGNGRQPGQWASSSRTPSVTVSSVAASYTSTLHYNVECSAVNSCALFRNDDNEPRSPSSNPTADATQCTYRASDFFKIMTNGHRNWRGDAHEWDTAAASVGWTVRSWPRPDSIAVWQPNMGEAHPTLGHVGYVGDTRVSSGRLQMKVWDRNWGPTDRDGVWVNFVPGMKFIVAAPRVHRPY